MADYFTRRWGRKLKNNCLPRPQPPFVVENNPNEKRRAQRVHRAAKRQARLPSF